MSRPGPARLSSVAMSSASRIGSHSGATMAAIVIGMRCPSPPATAAPTTSGDGMYPSSVTWCSLSEIVVNPCSSAHFACSIIAG